MLLAGALVAMVFTAYFPVWRAGFIWDDDAHLTANPCIVGPLGFSAIWTSSSAVYYPLVLTSFWIQHALWGLNSAPYHLVDIGMHAACGVLLWRVLLVLRVRGAWLGAALWALHPVNVESAAWVTELKNTQSCFFYLLSIFFFLNERETIMGSTCFARRRYTISLLCAALAILSKSSTVMLPVVLGLCAWWMAGRWRWRETVRLLPFLVISLAASGWTIWEQKFHSGATGREWAQSWPDRVAIAGRAFWFYLGKLAWPHPLIFIYPRWTIDSSRVLAFAPFAAAAVVLFALWLGRNGWSGRARPFFFAMAYFAVSLFPVLGFFSIYFFRYSFVADHFQYLAAIGPLALAGAGIAALGDFIGRKNQVVLHGACGVLLLALGILSFEQSGIYRDIETLWRATLRSNPGCWLAFNNLGDALMQSGRPADAEASYQKALALHPDYADAHNNLGNILRQQGRLDEAIAHYEKALAIQPAFADALNDLGTAFLQQGRVDEAAVEFEKAAAINPGAPEIHYNLGNVLLRQRRPAEAAAEYQKALKLKPDYAAGRNNLATALLQQGRVDEAVDQFREAIRNDPAYAKARINLAAVLRRTGHATEAASQYEQALKIDSSNAEAQSGLAWILAAAPDPSLRNGARAVALAENANQSTGGGHPEVLRTLAAAYAEAGRFPEAVDAMARALQTPQVRQNQTLAMALREELQLYQSGAAFRDPRMAAAPANQPGG